MSLAFDFRTVLVELKDSARLGMATKRWQDFVDSLVQFCVTHELGALPVDQPLFGAGGGTVKTGSKSGSTNDLATVSGEFTEGHIVSADGNGNLIDGGPAPSGVNTVPFSATPTFDLALGAVQKIELTGDVTSITLNNPVAGATYTLLIIQDAVGGRTFTDGGLIRGLLTVGTTASMASLQQFIYDGTQYFAVSLGISEI